MSDTETTSQKGILCTERVRMNAIAGLLFLFGGDGIILYSVMRDAEMSLGSAVSILCGIIGIILGLYYLFTFMNRRIFVNEKGVVYVNWLGKKMPYDWDQVKVSYHLGRNAYFNFMLGSKKATFYGYDINAEALYEYLVEHNRFDHDTMEAIRARREKEEDRIREYQKKARQNDAHFDDDDE